MQQFLQPGLWGSYQATLNVPVSHPIPLRLSWKPVFIAAQTVFVAAQTVFIAAQPVFVAIRGIPSNVISIGGVIWAVCLAS